MFLRTTKPVALILTLLVLPLATAWANIPYEVEGVVAVHADAVTLNTPDGRVFQLDLSRAAAAKFDDRYVWVRGVARQCDEVYALDVKKIELRDPNPQQVVLPPYKTYQRPARMVSANDEAIVMTDVRWGAKPGASGQDPQFNWETVTIRPDLLEKVYFVRKPFPPEKLAGHSLFLFTFKPGGCVSSRGSHAKGIVLSIEAYQRIGQTYSIAKGLKRLFGTVWIVASWEDYTALNCDLGNSRLIPFPVLLSRAQSVQLLRDTLREAAVNRTGEYYHTITNNCTNNLIVLLNRVLPKKIKMWWIPSLVYNLRATMPGYVPALLTKKGILGPPLPELNRSNYFADFEQGR